MRSSKANSFERRKNFSYQSQSSVKLSVHPTPLDFEHFIPWVCLEFKSPQYVVVTRVIKEDYITLIKRASSIKLRQKTSKGKRETSETIIEIKPKSSFSTINSKSTNVLNTVPIKAYYNNRGQLVEIEIVNCALDLSRKVIQAINLCVPFHSKLNKFSITRVKISHSVVYDISKVVAHSNITEVSFDDIYLPEGNYYILLDKLNELKCLSLRRCDINDEVCKKIAERLAYGNQAAKTFNSLDLSSNRISDDGAMALGDVLRKNRRLLHLNISNNRITDEGAIYILKHLLRFPLNPEEIVELKHRRSNYYKKKLEVFKNIYEDLNSRAMAEANKENIYHGTGRRMTEIAKLRRSTRKIKKNVASFNVDELSLSDQAEKATNEIVGNFKYIYDDRNVVHENEQIYSIGNLTLCFLNLAYNNLGYFTVQKIHEVVKYQNQVHVPKSHYTGLLRIVLDGNNMPACPELDEVEILLDLAIVENQSASVLMRNPSSLKSFKQKKIRD